MHHEHSDIGVCDDMTRHATDQAFAKPAAPITANDQQIGTVLLRGLQQRLADPSVACIDQTLCRLDTMQGQIFPQSHGGFQWHWRPLNAEDLHLCRAPEKWHRRTYRLRSCL